jgi:hypothetical protein
MAKRRRLLQVMFTLVVLTLVVGMAVWKFRGRLVWSPERPQPGEGIEESGEP